MWIATPRRGVSSLGSDPLLLMPVSYDKCMYLEEDLGGKKKKKKLERPMQDRRDLRRRERPRRDTK